jgi:hypothetical protein
VNRRALRASARDVMLAALAALTVIAALLTPASAAWAHRAAWAGSAATTGAPAGTPAPGGTARNVLLLNGDRALLNPAGAAGPGVILPSAHGPLGAVTSWSVGGTSYDIPYTALPYLGRGLDMGLFDTSLLRAHEQGGRLPVRISYHGNVSRMPGITVTGSGSGTATGYLTASSARAFGAALASRNSPGH